MNIKMIAIDIDGTLVNDEGKLTFRTIKVIKQVMEKDIKVVLATGRDLKSCLPISKELNINEPIICHNGGAIIDSKSYEIVNANGFQLSEMIDIVHYLRNQKLSFDVQTMFDSYMEEESYKEFQALCWQNHTQVIDDVFKVKAPIIKMNILANPSNINSLHQIIRIAYPAMSIVISSENCINIMAPGVNKAYGLRQLSQHYNINLDEIVAFGNHYNDYEMLKAVGYGIAMENAPQDLKRNINRITLSNNDDGVAYMLEQLLLNRKEEYIQRTNKDSFTSVL